MYNNRIKKEKKKNFTMVGNQNLNQNLNQN